MEEEEEEAVVLIAGQVVEQAAAVGVQVAAGEDLAVVRCISYFPVACSKQASRLSKFAHTQLYALQHKQYITQSSAVHIHLRSGARFARSRG